ncbi:hypothetical protein DM02DRAFT_437903 [Periconia macrospinosa]|uniref:Uncharacterized protein n=1 Tax=Periconia macrospinosa TaxID=97972 RepID=A0A2V1DM12_9PLEO|nr:hypothetical protein DM02DRAFT_437903 [Periconia macrospinosa]
MSMTLPLAILARSRTSNCCAHQLSPPPSLVHLHLRVPPRLKSAADKIQRSAVQRSTAGGRADMACQLGLARAKASATSNTRPCSWLLQLTKGPLVQVGGLKTRATTCECSFDRRRLSYR